MALGEFHMICGTEFKSIKIIVEKFFIIPSNKHYTLGFSPFMSLSCNKAIYSMHEKVSFHLDGIMIDVPTSVISNSLD